MVFYLQIMFGLLCLLSIYAVFKSLLFNLHMFQLNSYHPSKQIKWIFKNIGRLSVEAVLFALSFTGFITDEKLMGFAAAAILIAVTAMLPENKVRPAKKPLVYTPRVKRLIATCLVIYAAVFALAVSALMGERKNLAFFAVALVCSLTPAVVIIADIINIPMEKAVNNHYLRQAKALLRASDSLETIGITGSYGKTGTKYYLYTLLRAWTDTLFTPGSINTPMGIVKIIRGRLRSYHKIFVCEMGADHVGDIKEICDFVKPSHGIITALGEQHLATFGSKENIIKTKYELADALPEAGRLYVNYDNETIRKNPPKRPFIKYGTHKDCDYRAFDITVTEKGTAFSVKAPDGSVTRFETVLFGVHNVINITGAIAAANGFGMPMEIMPRFVRRIEAVAHRMQIIKKNGVTIIDDAFNSNPAGCKAALETLSLIGGEKVLVTPGMVELGKEEYALNKEFGKQAASVCDRVYLIGKKQTAAIFDGLKEASFPDNRIFIYEDFKDAMKNVYSYPSNEKKIVLLENDLPDNY